MRQRLAPQRVGSILDTAWDISQPVLYRRRSQRNHAFAFLPRVSRISRPPPHRCLAFVLGGTHREQARQTSDSHPLSCNKWRLSAFLSTQAPVIPRLTAPIVSSVACFPRGRQPDC
jgi:hypothetical protein